MSNNKLYVGNLAYSVRDQDLQDAFGAYGAVQSAKVMMDRDTGRSKGFGFVEMTSDAEAQAAINGLNGAPAGSVSVGNLVADPRFFSVPAANFRLTVGSAAIDTADQNYTVGDDFDGRVRPRGAGFDIGAHEY